jgi:hypothetical protein
MEGSGGNSGLMGAGTPPLGDEGFCRAPRLSFLTGAVHMSAVLVPGLGERRDVGRRLGLMGGRGVNHTREPSFARTCLLFFSNALDL